MVATKELDKAEKKGKERELGVGGLVLLGIIIWALASKPRKQFECPYCDATFKTKAETITHILDVHYGEPPEFVECPLCDAVFKTIWELIAHIREVHPKE